MGWRENEFHYSNRLLRVIADYYVNIYEGFPVSLRNDLTNTWEIAEFKADFDNALDSIGCGNWRGIIDSGDFKYYHSFGKLQRIVIADIMGITDDELDRMRFYNTDRLRLIAYSKMRRFLNGEQY